MEIQKLDDIANRLCLAKGWASPKYIDNGASAAVYSTQTKHGPAALKIYDPVFFEGENALIEFKRIELQTQLQNHGCEYLIEVLEAEEIPEDGTWYLLMEYCPWPSLEKQLPLVPDKQVHALIKQLVLAVKFLEQHALVHRDIKPANVVVSNDFTRLKLLDFGVIRKIAFDEGSGTDGHKFIATAQYSPPEFLLREEAAGEAGFNAINIYQIGAVLHDLITKTPLFQEEKSTKNRFKLFKAVTSKIPRVVSDTVPSRLIAVCLAALHKDPEKRSAAVTLDDFLADTDDLDALRRRIAPAPSNIVGSSNPLLITTWDRYVRSWGREAAQIEAGTLGSVSMKPAISNYVRQWRLDFKGADAPIYLTMRRETEGFSVHVIGNQDEDLALPVFTIDRHGPSIPDTGIPGALAGQYLYAIDRALARLASSDNERSTGSE